MASILIVMGNPKPESLCNSICEQYALGARAAGHEVEIVKLNQFSLDCAAPNAPNYEPPDWAIEQQEKVKKCDHLVLITPMWWGSMTAALKTYLDQVFLSGVTFRYREDGGYDKLCLGKTSEVIITSDTPSWVYFSFMGAPLVRTFKMHILEFCGFKFKRATMFSPTIKSTQQTVQKWLGKAKALGNSI